MQAGLQQSWRPHLQAADAGERHAAGVDISKLNYKTSLDTCAQAADVGEYDSIGVAAGDARAPGIAAEAWVEPHGVHRPLPHVQPLLFDAVGAQDVLQVKGPKVRVWQSGF